MWIRSKWIAKRKLLSLSSTDHDMQILIFKPSIVVLICCSKIFVSNKEKLEAQLVRLLKKNTQRELQPTMCFLYFLWLKTFGKIWSICYVKSCNFPLFSRLTKCQIAQNKIKIYKENTLQYKIYQYASNFYSCLW